ncbi:MAG: helix-turn-helix transcriptional regulator [Spirochaetaceae bacterium]|nr:helix-turn-helix transcriptional regulator [Spirochaetaceae bacterium]
MADIGAYDRVKERLEAGADEMIPAEFGDRILDGESPVRVWREYRGLSIKQLAASANISAAYLSQIEGRTRNGSLPTLRALAKGLSVDVDDLT